ncbi:hypothetical protein HPB52_003416 [Rhipicephalus sanguineus]|uniref:Uncharacterized protein n=1 Tax=Rhipicephalus sanguineus TaxID=34632 RepID=A0A9D4SXF4_RHISA|nr:hypothetical protein HPB52_003416 [Rhipicephalus sanguineus]
MRQLTEVDSANKVLAISRDGGDGYPGYLRGQQRCTKGVKLQLEEKQRATRRQREAEAEAAAAQGRPYVGHEPAWFRKETDPVTGNPIHVYQNEYWGCKEQAKWDRCPSIYL